MLPLLGAVAFIYIDSVISDSKLLPPLGWSSWNSVGLFVNDSFIRESALLLSQNLSDYGYEYILIDDGWPLCLEMNSNNGFCTKPSPRNSTTQRIIIDSSKFPDGFESLTKYVHSFNLKIGIYTAVSHTTCGGYTASLGYEEIDALAFIEWGFDFIKHDTCNTDCGIHTQCIQNSTYLMGSYLHQYAQTIMNKSIIYYVDDGNPSSGMRLWNPYQYNINPSAVIKVAFKPNELIPYWVNQVPLFNSTTNVSVINMFKSWFDRKDTWHSVLDNLHKQIGFEMYTRCGIFNMADMITTGQGNMIFTQYRAEFLLWSILGHPLIFGATLKQLIDNQEIYELITNKEIIDIDQDIDCVQGSMLVMEGSWEIWGKPLHDGGIAVVMLNKDEKNNINITLNVFGYHGYLYPMFTNYGSGSFHVRDIVNQKDLGIFKNYIQLTLHAMDAIMIKLSNFTANA